MSAWAGLSEEVTLKLSAEAQLVKEETKSRWAGLCQRNLARWRTERAVQLRGGVRGSPDWTLVGTGSF